MGFDPKPVLTLDDAKCLGDLVYSAYGLTYHRSFMYDPHRLLELNRNGSLTSMVAVDRETGRTVGHQATIRPWFETADPLPPGRGAPVNEVGLSIVDPDFRSQGIQNTLAMALLVHSQQTNPDARGFYIKCLTGPLQSQRSARRFGGHTTALFLAGVPAWVVVDGDERGPRQPLSTVLLYLTCVPEEPTQVVHVPAAHAEFVRGMYGATTLPREISVVRRAPRAEGDTDLRHWFDPARRHGMVRLHRPGRDVAQAVIDRVMWMVGGHIEHVSALLPMDDPATAAAVPALEEAGMFFGGVIPNFEGRDTLLMEWVLAPALDTSRIQVIGDESERLKNYVVTRWGEASDAAKKQAS